ncbi:MAG: helicase-associated domain-containing protein [Treponema sp.]|nr:helicase-associated domain-containing protein [Treponema sp.]
MTDGKTTFRTPEFWKESLVTLPDNAFFELVRTVFGRIRTPFNKQVLVDELERFLLREDIQRNVAGYIGEREIKIISAIALLDEPEQHFLQAFFSGDLDYAELNDLLVNLEERFLIYRFKDNTPKNGGFRSEAPKYDALRYEGPKGERSGAKRIALNPLFKSIFPPLVGDVSCLFPSVPPDAWGTEGSVSDGDAPPENGMSDTAGRGPFFYDDRLFATVLSFVSTNREFFKARGEGLRPKTLRSAQEMFPNLPLETFVDQLLALGLFFVEGEKLSCDYRRFSAFARLSRQERAQYYTAAVFCRRAYPGNPHDDAAGWILRTKVRELALFLNRLHAMPEDGMRYPTSGIKKMVLYLRRENGDFSTDCLVRVMAETGLLVPAGEGLWRKGLFPEAPAPLKDKPGIMMDGSFGILVSPEVDFGDLVKIAAFSDVRETGVNVRFEIGRESVVAAFDMGLTARAILDLLRRLSQDRVDENLGFTLRDWEKSYHEVTLRQGLVLVLAPDRRYLADTKPLSLLITETVAPGVYMLPAQMEERAVRALHKAGVGIVARRTESSDETGALLDGRIDGTYGNAYPPLRGEQFRPAGFPAARKPVAEPGSAADGTETSEPLLTSFRSLLDGMNFDREKHEELAARIDRKLILCEDQLRDAVLRYEKLEARGLDYAGKMVIAKTAVGMQALVEVLRPVNQTKERIVGIARALEKSGTESILVVKMTGENEETVRIPLGKISLLRRIKRSIFETNIF